MAAKKLTYKEAVTEIEEIIAGIENDSLDIDELSEKIKKAAALIKFCNDKLHNTEIEVEKILSELKS